MGRVVRSKFKVEVEIDGTRFETIQTSVNYAINEIPKAAATLAVGRNVTKNLKSAAIHAQSEDIRAFVPAKIFLTAEGDRTANDPWGGGEQMIFDGYLTGIGQRKSNGQFQVVANFIHWLSDLAASSSISSISHVTNPFAYHFGATKVLSTGAGGLGRQVFTGDYLGNEHLVNLVEDLWEEGVKRLLTLLAKQQFDPLFEAAERGDSKVPSNDAALSALARMVTAPNTPLSLNIENGIGHTVASTIGLTLCRSSIASFAGTTLWHKILEYAAIHMYSIAPRPNDVLIIPFMPCLRTDDAKQIFANEYESLEQNLYIPRPIRSVLIYGGKYYATMATPFVSHDVRLGFGGFFAPNEEGSRKGTNLVRPSPDWLAIASVVDPKAIESAANGQSLNIDGKLPEIPARGTSGEGTAEEINEKFSAMHKRYAKALYYNEVLRGRVGTLQGALRFDICPGSTVKIEGATDKFLDKLVGGSIGGAITPVDDPTGADIYATVTSVGIGLNAEASIAGTGFQLAYLRTVNENESESFATKEHPLYKNVFPGANLVDALS